MSLRTSGSSKIAARAVLTRRVTGFGAPFLVGGLSALYAWYTQSHPPHLLIDFDQNYAAAHFLRQGSDPYELIGPGRAFEWQWPLFYPLTTAVAALPFTLLPMWLAPIVLGGIGAAVFTIALQRSLQKGAWRFLALFSKPFLVAVVTGQASCLLASAFVLWPLASLAAIKPNIGAAIVAARTDRRGIIAALAGGAILLGISLALRPGWIGEWLSAVRLNPFRLPAVARPGGFLLVLSLLRWRRPEARLLFALAVVPQTLFIYDALPLFFVPRRATEAIGLVILSHFALVMALNVPAAADVSARIFIVGDWVVWSLFLPCLALVLLRPNEGDSTITVRTPLSSEIAN
jgi:hypothetical protein